MLSIAYLFSRATLQATFRPFHTWIGHRFDTFHKDQGFLFQAIKFCISTCWRSCTLNSSAFWIDSSTVVASGTINKALFLSSSFFLVLDISSLVTFFRCRCCAASSGCLTIQFVGHSSRTWHNEGITQLKLKKEKRRFCDYKDRWGKKTCFSYVMI